MRRIAARLGGRVLPRAVFAAPRRASIALTCASCVAAAQRWASQAKGPLDMLPPGCKHVTLQSFEADVSKSREPSVLLFHAPSNDEVLAYTNAVIQCAEATNRRFAGGATDSDGSATTSGLALRLGLVNCEKELALAQHFRLDPHSFPIAFFISKGQVVDKMIGIVPDSQITEALAAFLEYAGKSDAQARDAGKPDRLDDHDENVMTLQQVALQKVRDKDYTKAMELFSKARAVAEKHVDELKQKLGVHAKKMTPEIVEKLKKDGHYVALPQTICGQAMTRLALNDLDEAWSYCQEVRKNFPWAIRDNRQIADTMCRVAIIKISDYDTESDNYVTLLKRDNVEIDAPTFYSTQVKLAVAHFFERHPELAIEELLRLIRAERKLMPELKAAGVITPPEDGSVASTQNATPARRVLFSIFEALGPANSHVVDARKKLAAYLHAYVGSSVESVGLDLCFAA